MLSELGNSVLGTALSTGKILGIHSAFGEFIQDTFSAAPQEHSPNFQSTPYFQQVFHLPLETVLKYSKNPKSPE